MKEMKCKRSNLLRRGAGKGSNILHVQERARYQQARFQRYRRRFAYSAEARKDLSQRSAAYGRDNTKKNYASHLKKLEVRRMAGGRGRRGGGEGAGEDGRAGELVGEGQAERGGWRGRVEGGEESLEGQLLTRCSVYRSSPASEAWTLRRHTGRS
jgi:hypothetical protein